MGQEWTVEKHLGLGQALIVFLVPIFFFIITLMNFYFLSPSTELFLRLLPLIFAIVAFFCFLRVVRTLRDYPEIQHFKINEEGISLQLPEKGNQERTLSWPEMREYDVLESSRSGINRIQIKTSHEDESLEVVAPSAEMNSLIAILGTKEITFGYVRSR
ncbi:MAG: SoxR reducing system RseC family protein [bacterium]|nr:SoxR reducing system RseC family protein [bacterium]